MVQFNSRSVTIPVFRAGVPRLDLAAQIAAARAALAAQR
jgi:hypothetical protein